MNADFDFLAHQAGRIVHAGLAVDDELLRKEMQGFAIFRQWDGAGLFDGSADVFAADLAGAPAKGNSAMAVYAANMRAGDADDSVLDGGLGNVLSFLNGLLDGVDSLVEIGDDAFAHAARIGDAMAAIAQGILVDFGDHDASLGASNINDR